MDKTLKYTLAYICNLANKVNAEYNEHKEKEGFDTSVFYAETQADRAQIDTLLYIVSLRLMADTINYYPTINKIEIIFNLRTPRITHEVSIDNFEEYVSNQILD